MASTANGARSAIRRFPAATPLPRRIAIRAHVARNAPVPTASGACRVRQRRHLAAAPGARAAQFAPVAHARAALLDPPRARRPALHPDRRRRRRVGAGPADGRGDRRRDALGRGADVSATDRAGRRFTDKLQPRRARRRRWTRRPWVRRDALETCALRPISPAFHGRHRPDADPGTVDPVPVARDITPRADGRVDLHRPARSADRRAVRRGRARRRQAKLRAKQVFHWLYHRGATEFEAMTDIAKTMRPWLAERFVIGRPGSGRGAAFDRRHAQVAAAHRRRPRLRDGLHSRRRPRHAVRLEPGRLHAQLPLLPHRHDAPGAQPDAGRDRRPGHARARRARRMAQGTDGRSPTRRPRPNTPPTGAC